RKAYFVVTYGSFYGSQFSPSYGSSHKQGTGNREQFQLSRYPQFLISDKEKCNCFETPFAKTLHLLVLKIGETTINRRFYVYSASPS
ncbi:hypothetical protein MEO39_24560, partial [Dolichospermum sp. ST_sed2]|nr:hypothetical protein [Dolichospermum sp. ST_sed9]MDD1449173.1 hypothetical protein [Dolichospermum sp. ST_sed8]MDD1457832.1 hypothetical protein [Dolichospermum sp. ST_sed7]MDD1463183.1 hypothetical protein [Dolichospermum sp. ST_sed2]MDD1474387.1 hypothetical protein [Dolichospermum sp. ST_sed4]